MKKKIFNSITVVAVAMLCITAVIGGCSKTKKANTEKEVIHTPKESTEEVNTYQPCSYDEYDTSDFPLELRNKTDMEKKRGIYYEVFVRSFCDSDGDGIGDFKGLTSKLDYLKDLGVEGLWLMPINKSPSYHGYDVEDYYAVNPDYGTEEDFKELLEEAHKRGIKIIMDFVINHTSSTHPWFKQAISSEDNEYRNYYRWVKPEDTVDFNESCQSAWGTYVWHKSGNDYYYGIFTDSMPDLNYNNPKAREEVKKAAEKWLNMGVDGFRLDAAIHIYGNGEYKQQPDSTKASIQWWNEFAKACESVKPDVYLVGEAWNDSDPLADYVQPFDSKFNFTFQDDMINAVIREKSISLSSQKELAKSLEDLLSEYKKVDSNYIDAIFGSNHDKDRVMSKVRTIEKAKLVASIYLTIPGNPYIYYGEEIGMKGAGEDPNKRRPFEWENVEGNELYAYYKEIIQLRKEHKAMSEGTFSAYDAKDDKLFAYELTSDDEKLLVIHNMARKEIPLDQSITEGKEIIYSENFDNNKLGSLSTIVIKE